MDHLKNTTMHQKYKHLSVEDRVIIQIRLKDGWTGKAVIVTTKSWLAANLLAMF